MRRDFSNQSGDSPDHGAYDAIFQNKAETARFPDQGGDGATKNQFLTTKAETTRLSREKRRRHDPSDQDGDGAIFQTKAETARPILDFSRLR